MTFQLRHFRWFILVWMNISLVILSSCSKASEREPEIYLIPQGYTGSFHIVFNISDGAQQIFEDGARVYRIPDSGFLLIQSDSNTGRIRSDQIQFFYESPDGSREKIENRWTTSLHDTPENRSDDLVYVFGGGIGLIEPLAGCQLYSKSFYVGTKMNALDDHGRFDIYSERGIRGVPEWVFRKTCWHE